MWRGRPRASSLLQFVNLPLQGRAGIGSRSGWRAAAATRIRRFPAHPIEHPAPGGFLSAIRGWWRWWLSREYHSLSAISIGELLEYLALFLDPAVVGEQAKAVFQRVEIKLAVHVVAVPVAEPANPRVDGCQDCLLEPFRLLFFAQNFNAGVELLCPDRLSSIARTAPGVGPDQSCHGRKQFGAGRVHGAAILKRTRPVGITVHDRKGQRRQGLRRKRVGLEPGQFIHSVIMNAMRA